MLKWIQQPAAGDCFLPPRFECLLPCEEKTTNSTLRTPPPTLCINIIGYAKFYFSICTCSQEYSTFTSCQKLKECESSWKFIDRLRWSRWFLVFLCHHSCGRSEPEGSQFIIPATSSTCLSPIGLNHLNSTWKLKPEPGSCEALGNRIDRCFLQQCNPICLVVRFRRNHESCPLGGSASSDHSRVIVVEPVTVFVIRNEAGEG